MIFLFLVNLNSRPKIIIKEEKSSDSIYIKHNLTNPGSQEFAELDSCDIEFISKIIPDPQYVNVDGESMEVRICCLDDVLTLILPELYVPDALPITYLIVFGVLVLSILLIMIGSCLGIAYYKSNH